MAGALDIIQAVVQGVQLGQQILNVYHFMSQDAVLDADIPDDIGSFLQDMYSNLSANQVDDLDYISIIIKNITDGIDIGEFAWGGAQPSNTSDPLPTGIAGLVTLPTVQLGSRGRKFFGGLAEGGTTDGVFVGTLLTNLGLVGSDLVSGFTGATSGSDWQYVIVKSAGGVLVPVAFTVSNIPAYQRRRKVGVGE